MPADHRSSGFLASLIQSSGGRVQVVGITIPTQNGQWVAADLFRPKSATEDSPAPLVVVVPGFQRSRETLSNISLGLARRGIVVIAIDPYAQGDSGSSMSVRAATEEGYGMYAVVEYAAKTGNLNYVDRKRIGATGHSRSCGWPTRRPGRGAWSSADRFARRRNSAHR